MRSRNISEALLVAFAADRDLHAGPSLKQRSAMVEALNFYLGVDMSKVWAADDAALASGASVMNM